MEKKRRSVKRRNRVLVPPPINTISDLIELGNTDAHYQNINIFTVKKILPQLKEIDKMIGMVDLKESVLSQIKIFLLGLHAEDYLHTAIMGPPGTGKCLGLDTSILMYNGSTKKVQDIVVGDILMGDDSSKTIVVSTCQGYEDLYKIEQSHGMTYIVNASHILSLQKEGNTVDIELKDVLEKYSEYNGYRMPAIFPAKVTSIDPYLLGYIIPKKSSIFKEIGMDESLFFVDNQHVFEYLSSAVGLEDIDEHWFKISISEYTDILHHPHIPDEFKMNDPMVLKHVLAGICDSIGVYSTDKVTLHLSDIQLYEDLIYVCNRLCIPTVTSMKYASVQIVDERFAEQRVEHKFCTITIDYSLIPIKSIPGNSKYTGDLILSDITITLEEENGRYYGFELDGTSRFQLEDGTVTHNTTIARIIGEMYKNMGILSNGTFTMAKREQFVAEYLGQSAPKTKRLLDSCKGGVLFIDEAYALGPGSKDKDSFSKEAIDTLNAYLYENLDFCCIIAGYEDELRECFFKVNPGLERRFPFVHRIGEYSTEDLVDIFFKLVEEAGWNTNVSKKDCNKIIFSNKDLFKYFGGDIQNYIHKCKLCHASRIISEENPEKFVYTKSDLEAGIELMKKNQVTPEEKDDGPPMHMYM
jgi:hypothetical protein